MPPENGMNDEIVKYFSVVDYVNNIKLTNALLEHLEQTNNDFDNYLKCLSKYDDYAVIYYFISSLSREIKSTQQIEGQHYISPDITLKSNIFFDTLQMNHTRIKNLHKFVTFSDEIDDYRKTEVRVSRMTQMGEQIFWRGVQAKDVKQFMTDFISLYKGSSLSLINSNPFLKSALMHLIFVRIHPFTDGNGRTARMIHNMKFTDSINKIYGMNLKISPLNLSQSILLNQIAYVDRINDIYFDLEHDSNVEINKWFNFILNLVDEQLFYAMSKLPKLERGFYNISSMKEADDNEFKSEINKMKIRINN